MLAEKWHHIILETICYLAGVSTLIHFEAVCDSILVERIVQFRKAL